MIYYYTLTQIIENYILYIMYHTHDTTHNTHIFNHNFLINSEIKIYFNFYY